MSLSLQRTLRLIEASHAKAAELGITLTTAVVDEGGYLIALGRMDGARWVTAEIAQAKAACVAAFPRPGPELVRLAERPWFPALVQRLGGRLAPALGAMPIYEDNQLVGGIGASGGTGEQDQECVEAALAAVK